MGEFSGKDSVTPVDLSQIGKEEEKEEKKDDKEEAEEKVDEASVKNLFSDLGRALTSKVSNIKQAKRLGTFAIKDTLMLIDIIMGMDEKGMDKLKAYLPTMKKELTDYKRLINKLQE